MTDTFRHIVWSKNVRSFTHEGPQLTIYMFRLSMSFGKMCLLIIRRIYFWYCLYLFAICKWEVEQWFSCFKWFSFFFARFKKKNKVWSKNVKLMSWANFWEAATLWRFPGSPSYLSLDSLSLNFPIVAWFHNLFCSWWQWLMMTIANIPKLPILPFLINLSENHTWICFKMGYIQRQLDRFSN